MVPAALAGLGLGLIPEYFVSEHLADGTLVEVLSEWNVDLPPSEWSKIDDILDYEGDKECRARSIARKRLSASCVKRRLCWRRARRPRRRVGGSRSASNTSSVGARTKIGRA